MDAREPSRREPETERQTRIETLAVTPSASGPGARHLTAKTNGVSASVRSSCIVGVDLAPDVCMGSLARLEATILPYQDPSE